MLRLWKLGRLWELVYEALNLKRSSRPRSLERKEGRLWPFELADALCAPLCLQTVNFVLYTFIWPKWHDHKEVFAHVLCILLWTQMFINTVPDSFGHQAWLTQAGRFIILQRIGIWNNLAKKYLCAARTSYWSYVLIYCLDDLPPYVYHFGVRLAQIYNFIYICILQIWNCSTTLTYSSIFVQNLERGI